jgi:Polyketide cyclase / dehydrase and lipid transport
MNPTFVMTSAWWLEAPPQAPWQLIADAPGWPTWWRSIRAVCGARAGGEDGRTALWRAASGLRLSLRVRPRVAEPCDLIEWQIHGDLRARATWVVAEARPGGCDVISRWEFMPVPGGSPGLRTITRVLLERSHFRRMRACASDMGSVLGCRTTRLREWSCRSRA